MPRGMKLLLVLWSPLSAIPLAMVLAHAHVPQPFSYAWHKALHVLGAVMFLGDMLTQAFWLTAARMTNHGPAIRASYRALDWTDTVFLGPGMFLLVANGSVLAQAWGGVERWSWMLSAVILFGLYGMVSVPLMWIQIKGFRVLATAPDDKLGAELDAVSRGKGLGLWLVLMIVVPLVILVFMVVKPKLW